MSDTLILTGPSGSSMNLASYVLADPGWDSGEADLLKAAYAENPAAEGAVLAFETVNHRQMQFPVRIASTSAFTSAGAAAWMRTLARPGATLDVLLDGVPTAEAVRFDVLTGRYENAQWNTQQFTQTDRFDGTLKLDVQPFGYWPTMILLASSASVGAPGVLALDTTKIIGDVPGPAEVFIAPTSATSYGAVQKTDSVYWSLGAAPSFQAWWVAASALMVGSNTNWTPTLIGDKYAPASQAVSYRLAVSMATWTNLTSWVIPPSLEPAYRGRFRAYSWVRYGPSVVANIYASMDVQAGTIVSRALASSAPIATVAPAVASDIHSGAQGASPAYSLLDLGEISLPPIASSPYDTVLRLWAMDNSVRVGTGLLDVGGLYLQPISAPAGVLPRGLLQPTWTSPSHLGRMLISAVTADSLISSGTSAVGSIGPLSPAYAYRGALPYVGASTIQLDLNLAGKQAQDGAPTGQPPLRSEPHYAQVSVRYRPRFSFLKGI